MGDADQSSSAAERAGRAVARALRGLFGTRFLVKAKESAEALRDEFREGAREAEEQPEPPPRAIAHRELAPEPDEPDQPDD